MSSRASLSTDFLADVLAHIEAHLFEPMTVGELARVAGFSPYHFSRLFAARFGESPIGYVRLCRLQAAARRLSGATPPTLIDLAFDCGFESQEAFTRAFRKLFGVPPGQFRRETPKQQSREIPMSDFAVLAHVEQLNGLVTRPSFRVAGVGALFNAENKSGIPALWPRLVRVLPLPHQKGGETYGVCQMVDKSEGCFRYVAGVEIAGDAILPEGFETLDLEAQTYAVFRLTLDGTALHPQMQAAMPKIWGDILPKSGLKLAPAPDFELYPVDFEPNRRGSHVDIYLPVAG